MKNILSFILFLSCAFAIHAQTDDSDIFFPVEIGCLDFERGLITIKNQQEYEALIVTGEYGDFCYDFIHPEINWDDYLLIGVDAFSSGCHIKIDKSIIEHSDRHMYEIKIVINMIGLCRPNNWIHFWNLVPKQPDKSYDYEIKLYRHQEK